VVRSRSAVMRAICLRWYRSRLTALLGFVFPLIATMFHFGELTHDTRALIYCHVHRPWDRAASG